MRLIDADALYEKMKHRYDWVGRPSDALCLIEDAPTVNGWISVKESLPAYDYMVLVTRREGARAYVETAYYMPESGAWVDPLAEYAIRKPGPITHWMPMPKPAKG